MWKYKILCTEKIKQKACAQEGKLLHLLQLSFKGRAGTTCEWRAGNLCVPADFAVFAVLGVGEVWSLVHKCFLLALGFCRASTEVKPNIYSHPTTVRLNLIHKRDDDSWGKGSFLVIKQALLSTWFMANNPKDFLFYETTYNDGIKDLVWREAGWSLVLNCCGPLWAGKSGSRKGELPW